MPGKNGNGRFPSYWGLQAAKSPSYQPLTTMVLPSQHWSFQPTRQQKIVRSPGGLRAQAVRRPPKKEKPGRPHALVVQKTRFPLKHTSEKRKKTDSTRLIFGIYPNIWETPSGLFRQPPLVLGTHLEVCSVCDQTQSVVQSTAPRKNPAEWRCVSQDTTQMQQGQAAKVRGLGRKRQKTSAPCLISWYLALFFRSLF